MKETGRTTKLVERGLTNILMGQSMRDSGLMTISTERAFKLGPMGANTMAIITRAKRMAKANTLGEMGATILEHGRTTK
jgi:hypothetical protein